MFDHFMMCIFAIPIDILILMILEDLRLWNLLYLGILYLFELSLWLN